MALGDVINPTLTATGKTFWSTNSNTLTLFNCDTEVIQKDAGLVFAAMPVLSGTTTAASTSNYDSNNSIAGDLLGNTRSVQLQGRFTTSDVAEAFKFTRDLTSIGSVNAATLLYSQGTAGGAGVAGYKYTPVSLNLTSTGAFTGSSTITLGGNTYTIYPETINVYVKSATVTFKAGEPNTVDYSISLGECNGGYSL